MSLSINSKVSFGATLLVVFGFSILGVTIFLNTKSAVTEMALDAQQTKVTQVDSLVSVYLHEKQRLIATLASNISQNDLDESLMIQNLALIQKSGAFNLSYIGLEENGRMLRGNGNHQYPKDGYEPRDRSWYSIVKKSQKDEILGVPWIQASYKIPVFGFSSPIIKGGKFVGVVGSDVLDSIKEVKQEKKRDLSFEAAV
ncbi:cache domain-containing protein [Helicobacter typhlonius]|uniref:cache domain-containing protein n=1 Tax=Helicobacter TaxID=209 RepID=UPI002FE029B0